MNKPMIQQVLQDKFLPKGAGLPLDEFKLASDRYCLIEQNTREDHQCVSCGSKSGTMIYYSGLTYHLDVLDCVYRVSRPGLGFNSPKSYANCDSGFAWSGDRVGADR